MSKRSANGKASRPTYKDKAERPAYKNKAASRKQLANESTKRNKD